MAGNVVQLTLADGRVFALLREAELSRWDNGLAADQLHGAVVDAIDPDALVPLAGALGYGARAGERGALLAWLAEELERGELVAIELEAPPLGAWPVLRGSERIGDPTTVIPLKHLRRDPPPTDEAWVEFRVVDGADRPFGKMLVLVHYADRPSAAVKLDASGLHRVENLDRSARVRVELPTRRDLPVWRERGRAMAAASSDIVLRAAPGAVVQLPKAQSTYRIVVREAPPGFSG